MHQTGKVFDPAKPAADKEQEKKDAPAEEPELKNEKAEEKPETEEKVSVEPQPEIEQKVEVDHKPELEKKDEAEQKQEVEQKPDTEHKAEIEIISVPTTEELTEKATEKLDTDLIEKLYYECKDDFEGIADLISTMKAESVSIDKVKKINLILKIVLKNPILKKLKEVQQLFAQGQSITEYMQNNFSSIEEDSILEKSETVLNYLKKENILNTSNSIIEKINRLGLIHKQFEMNSPKKESPLSELESVRNKIVKKQLVSDAGILKSLDDNLKS